MADGLRAGSVAVDIGPTFARKLAALREHTCQFGGCDSEPCPREVAARCRREKWGVALAEAFTVL